MQLVRSNEDHRYWSVKPGSVNRKHREVLLFIVSEFDRLIRTYPDIPDTAKDGQLPFGVNIPGFMPIEHIQSLGEMYRSLAKE